MRVAIKLNLATVPGICKNCSHGMVRKVWAGDVSTFCLSQRAPIREPVLLCTQFEERSNTPYDMRAKGWILEINPRGQIGFHRPGTREHSKVRHDTPFPGE